MPAPLELVMDNFCEVEHTATTHRYFGYPLEQMHEVTLKVDADPLTTHVNIVGPARQLPVWMGVLMGTHKGYVFNDDWTSYFSPCYGVYDHWFSNPRTGRLAAELAECAFLLAGGPEKYGHGDVELLPAELPAEFPADAVPRAVATYAGQRDPSGHQHHVRSGQP